MISKRLRDAGLPIVSAGAVESVDGVRVHDWRGDDVLVRSSFSDGTHARLVAQDVTRELERQGYAVTPRGSLTTLEVSDPLASPEFALTRRARELVVALLNGESVELPSSVARQLDEHELTREGVLWIERARALGLRVASSIDDSSRLPVVHVGRSSRALYDQSQTNELIAHGDVLHALDERVIGVLVDAWPVAITAELGEFHAIKGHPVSTWFESLGNDPWAVEQGAREAVAVARQFDLVLSAGWALWAHDESCILCGELVENNAQSGRIGERTGKLCNDCAFYADGNVITTREDTK